MPRLVRGTRDDYAASRVVPYPDPCATKGDSKSNSCSSLQRAMAAYKSPLSGIPSPKDAIDAIKPIELADALKYTVNNVANSYEDDTGKTIHGKTIICAICTLGVGRRNEGEEEDSRPVVLHGTHVFCYSCALPWIADMGTCPTCRHQLFIGQQEWNALKTQESNEIAAILIEQASRVEGRLRKGPSRDSEKLDVAALQYLQEIQRHWITMTQPGSALAANDLSEARESLITTRAKRFLDKIDSYVDYSEWNEYSAKARKSYDNRAKDQRWSESQVRVAATEIRAKLEEFFEKGFAEAILNHCDDGALDVQLHPLAFEGITLLLSLLGRLDQRRMERCALYEYLEKAVWNSDVVCKSDWADCLPEQFEDFLHDMISYAVLQAKK